MSPADGPLSRACIAGGLRTPIAHRGGALSRILPEDLGALVIRALLQRYGIAGREVCGVLAGNAVGTEMRRQAVEKALRDLRADTAVLSAVPDRHDRCAVCIGCGGSLDSGREDRERPGGLLSRRWDGERLTSAAAHLCGA